VEGRIAEDVLSLPSDGGAELQPKATTIDESATTEIKLRSTVSPLHGITRARPQFQKCAQPPLQLLGASSFHTS
jgi:hypothetical protein